MTEADNPKATLIFAHGAGAGMDHPFMQTIANGLAAAGIRVVRFNFPYMQKRQEDGRKRPPDRQPKLLECFAEILTSQAGQAPLFIAGKSMGGRMATLLASLEPEICREVKGILCLGYPFHAPGKAEQWRAEHFAELPCPTLLLQGERDSFGNRQEILEHGLVAPVSVRFITDGDHSFKPRKASGLSENDNQQTAISQMVEFIEAQLD